MSTDTAPPEPNRAVVPFTLPGWDHRLRGFHCGAEVDVFALVTERYLIFIDTSATPEQAAAVAEAMRAELVGRQPLVILTHADFDHAWGNAAFAPDGALPASSRRASSGLPVLAGRALASSIAATGASSRASCHACRHSLSAFA